MASFLWLINSKNNKSVLPCAVHSHLIRGWTNKGIEIYNTILYIQITSQNSTDVFMHHCPNLTDTTAVQIEFTQN